YLLPLILAREPAQFTLPIALRTVRATTRQAWHPARRRAARAAAVRRGIPVVPARVHTRIDRRRPCLPESSVFPLTGNDRCPAMRTPRYGDTVSRDHRPLCEEE